MSDESTVVSPASEEREPEELDAGSTRTSAMDLGDVTGVERPQVHPAQTVGDGDEVDYYRFTLTQARERWCAHCARTEGAESGWCSPMDFMWGVSDV